MIGVSVLAVVLSAKVLQRWDRPSAAGTARTGAEPWWRAWQRSALLTTLAIAIGAFGAGSDTWGLSAWSLFALCWAILPFVYRRVGIGIWSYEIEQLAIWSGWVAGTATVGIKEQGDYPGGWLAITFLMWFGCAICGAIMLRHGVREEIRFRREDDEASGN
jgi:hypothetical protein